MPKVHLVDATFELFRAYFSPGSKHQAPDGREVGGVRRLLGSMCDLLSKEGATHVACATDTVIRSFRNDLYAGYKTEEGVPEELLAQFPLAEEGLRALGLVVWGMVELEADDALAAGARRYAAEAEQVVICTPDKDMAQCVVDGRIVLLDRMRRKLYDEEAVRAKWGVAPASIPDWLALVGDSSDGYPGIPGWGEKSSAALLGVYRPLEAIPDDHRLWSITVRGADKLAAALASRRDEAALYKRLATLRVDVPPAESFADLEWRGATPALREFCVRHGLGDLADRVPRWAA